MTDVKVTVIDGNRIKVVTASRGLQGPQGPAGSGEGYVHDQPMPSALWTINHSLGKYPTVILTDTNLNSIDGLIEYVDLNTLTVAFNSTVAGKAVLN